MSTTMNLSTVLATYDAVHAAIEQHRPLSVIYATGGTIIKERVVRPERIAVGKRGSDLIICSEDSLRPGIVSLRLDRVVAISGQVAERY